RRLLLDDKPATGFGLILGTIVLFLPLAWFSKENGALLPVFLFLVELIFFRFRTNNPLHRKLLQLFYVIVLAFPAVFAVYYIYSHPGYFHGSYFSKYYTITERLLTETRVLWHYIRMILLPSPSVYGLYLDDIALSTGLLNPISTLLSMLAIVAALALAILIRKSQPILSFGILFFFAGHVMESSFIPLEIAFEHRNYLPAVGIIMIAGFYMLDPSLHSRSLKLRAVSLILFLLICIAITWSRVLDWRSNTTLHIAEVEHHPLSPRANYEAGRVYGMLLEKGIGNRQENIDRAFEYFTRSAELREDVTSALFGMIVASHDAGIKLDEKWFKMLEYRLEHQPYEQANIAWISSLTECIRKRKCTTKSTQLESLLKASERNRKINRRTRALLFAATSDYYLIAERSLLKALEYSQKAVKEKPSYVEAWLQLARIQILSNQNSKAIKTLERAQQKDVNKIFQKDISLLMTAASQRIGNR
ncbi:tetratricopeptide repeat protein, partial [Kaarinaea lacus]